MMNELGIIQGLIAFAVIIAITLAVAHETAKQEDFNDDIIRVIPILSTLYLWLFKPGTYYRIDSMEMFQKAVHNAVLEVVDQMTTEKGLRALADEQRKPVMTQFYERTARGQR